MLTIVVVIIVVVVVVIVIVTTVHLSPFPLIPQLLERSAEGGVANGSNRMAYDKRFLFKRAAPMGGAEEVVEPLINLPQ